MNAEAKNASMIIDSVAKAVANWTVDQYAEANPEFPKRYGSSWRSDWIDHNLSQIQLLAQAVSVRSEELFANSVRWNRESFLARGLDPMDLERNNHHLGEVLADELPPSIGARVAPFIESSSRELRRPSADAESEGSQPNPHEELVLKYLAAILEGDRATAETMILESIEQGVTVCEVYEKILAPAQARMGRMWHLGDITVADEHFGSAITQAVMSQLRPRFPRAASKDRVVVGTSTPGDLHDIGLRMVVDLFEVDGWSSMYLGANTPIADIIELLERRTPDLLTLSVSTALTLRDTGNLIETIRANGSIKQTNVLVGGPPFHAAKNLWRELGADGCALSASEAVRLGNQLTTS